MPEASQSRSSRPWADPFQDGYYRDVFDAMPDGIVVVDEEGTIREVNRQIEALFGYPPEELVGRKVEVLVPEEARSAHFEHRDRYVARPRRRPMGVGMVLEGRRRDGTHFPIEVSLSPLATEVGRFVISSVRDLTERRRMMRFTHSTLQAAEDERLRLAQELHDDTAQQLSTLLLRLKLARETEDAPSREERLDQVRDDIRSCAESVRRIARGLRPPELQDAGLAAAVRAHVVALSDAASVELDLDVDRVEPLLEEDTLLAVYRIVQEATTNVVRHARARTLTVRIARTGDEVAVLVEDDGVGFDVTELNGTDRGLGLVGIRERAMAVGGRAELDSGPGRGTRIRAFLPTVPESEPHG